MRWFRFSYRRYIRLCGPHLMGSLFFILALFRLGFCQLFRIVRLGQVYIRFLRHIRLRIFEQKQLRKRLFPLWQMRCESIPALPSAQRNEREIRIADRFGVEIADLRTDRVGAEGMLSREHIFPDMARRDIPFRIYHLGIGEIPKDFAFPFGEIKRHIPKATRRR